MSLAGFENLREVESLLKVEKEHLDAIEGHRQRLVSLEKQIQRQKDLKEELDQEIKLLRSEVTQKENELEKSDGLLEQTKKAVDSAKTQQQADSSQKQSDALDAKINTLQEEILEDMEKQESLQSQLDESLKFLNGVQETWDEVNSEVQKAIKQEESAVASLKERMQNLFSITPPLLVTAFKRSCEKHRYQHPLTYLTNRKCHYCRYTPESSLFDSLERADEAYYCNGCKRLFTPTTRRT